MNPLVILGVLGAGGIAYFLYQKNQTQTLPAPPAPGMTYDSGMDQATSDAVTQAIQTVTDPAQLLAYASQLTAKFPNAASMLTQAAAAVAAGKTPQQVDPHPGSVNPAPVPKDPSAPLGSPQNPIDVPGILSQVQPAAQAAQQVVQNLQNSVKPTANYLVTTVMTPLGIRTGPDSQAPFVQGGDPASGGGAQSNSQVKLAGLANVPGYGGPWLYGTSSSGVTGWMSMNYLQQV